MGKILCFIYSDMADFELTLATHIMAMLGKKVVPIAYDNHPVVSRPGLAYQPAVTVQDAFQLDDVDGLIIPGGWNNEQRPELTQLIQKLNSEDKLLAAICAGPQYLARAGVLQGKRYTTTLTAEELAKQNVADPFPRDTFLQQKVVRDGHIVTAVGVAFVDFAIELADYFGGFPQPGQKVQYANAYKGL